MFRAGTDPTAENIFASLRSRGVEILFGHYGAVRGRDDWKAATAMISIGDPRPNLGASHAVATALGLSGERDAVYRRATAAESSQVAGRGRTPWRETSLVHVHVGTVAPASWDARTDVVDMPKGRAETIASETISEAVRVHGSPRKGAASLNLSRQRGNRIADQESTGSSYLSPTHKVHPLPLSDTRIAAFGALCESPKTFNNRSVRALIDRFGGAKSVASELGVSVPLAYHWRSGARPMPRDAVVQLTAMLDALEVRDDCCAGSDGPLAAE